MRAYCINLDRRPDRLAHMTAEFARHGVPFERVSAVDGTDTAVAAAAGKCGTDQHKLKMSSGTYACFQSHRTVWHRITNSGDRYGMVFEDDVQLADGFAAYLDDAWVPADADLVRMETVGIRVLLDRAGLSAGQRRVHRMRGYQQGGGCYVIERTAAARLIDATADPSEPVDQVMFNPQLRFARSLQTYQMLPAPVIQGVFLPADAAKPWIASSLAQRFADRPTLKKPESTTARVARRLTNEVAGLVQGRFYPVIMHG